MARKQEHRNLAQLEAALVHFGKKLHAIEQAVTTDDKKSEAEVAALKEQLAALQQDMKLARPKTPAEVIEAQRAKVEARRAARRDVQSVKNPIFSAPAVKPQDDEYALRYKAYRARLADVVRERREGDGRSYPDGSRQLERQIDRLLELREFAYPDPISQADADRRAKIADAKATRKMIAEQAGEDLPPNVWRDPFGRLRRKGGNELVGRQHAVDSAELAAKEWRAQVAEQKLDHEYDHAKAVAARAEADEAFAARRRAIMNPTTVAEAAAVEQKAVKRREKRAERRQAKAADASASAA